MIWAISLTRNGYENWEKTIYKWIKELWIFLSYIFENIFHEQKFSPQQNEIAQEIVNLG